MRGKRKILHEIGDSSCYYRIYVCVSVCILDIDKANNYKRRYKKKV